jgi:asparagine synthase (glutamine-hydrolysing)
MGREAARLGRHVLNGEGGDPCFGGPKNVPMILSELYTSPIGRETSYLRAYRKCYDDLQTLLSPQIQEELRDMEPDEQTIAPFLANPKVTYLLNRLMLANVRLKGADHILTKVNNLTAANGLIGLSPLFDRRIVDFSFATPPAFKVSGLDEKLVLKRAVADLLPETIVTRLKSGMRVPVQNWFRYDLQAYARGLLLGRKARIKPYINQRLIKEWLGYRGAASPRQGTKLWQLLSLEAWLRVNE